MGIIAQVNCVPYGQEVGIAHFPAKVFSPDSLIAAHARAAKLIGDNAYVDILGFPCTPSLDLRAEKVKESGLPSAFTHTRTTSATYIDPSGTRQNASGGELRFDYDKTNHNLLGILTEPPRWQYLLNNSTPVTSTRSFNAENYVLWMEGTGSVTMSGGATGVATEGNPVYFTLTSTVSITFTVSGSVTAFQCENGATTTSLIVTGGSAYTRNADVLTASTSAFPFNSTEGTLYYEGCFVYDKPVGFTRLVSLSDGTAANWIAAYRHSTQQGYFGCASFVSGVIQGGFGSHNIVGAKKLVKVAFSYKKDSFKVSINGGDVITYTTFDVPSVNLLEVGRGSNGYSEPTLTRQVTYFPMQLPDWCLQTLTL